MFSIFSKKPFSVKMRGRAGFDYREQDKSVDIFSEFLHRDTFDIVIHFNKIRGWDSPPDSPPWTSEDRERIRKNITATFKRWRIEWI